MVAWLGRRTRDQQIASSNPGRGLPDYYLDIVTVCGRVNHLGTNSAFHPSGVGKSSIILSGWG